MRNKDMKASPFRWMLKRNLFLLVAVFLIAFAVFPMQGMMRVLSAAREMETRDGQLSVVTRQYYMKELTLDFVYSPLNLETLCALFGTVGFGAALVLFRHLFSRKQAMLAAGLPITRGRDFLLRTGVYLLMVQLPLAFCLAIYPAAVRAYGLWSLFDPAVYAMRAGSTLLINLYGYAVGALSAALFSTVWSATLSGAVLAVSGEAVMYGWIAMAGWYLHTMYPSGTIRNAARFFPAYTQYKNFYLPERVCILPGVLAAALFGVLAFLAYRRALPERAGHALNHRSLEPAVLAWAVVLGGTACAAVMALYQGQEAVLYIGLAFGALLAWILAGMLVNQRIRPDFRSWKAPAAAAAAMVCALLLLRADPAGYETYAPAAENLAAVRIRRDFGPGEIRLESPEEIEAGLAWMAQIRKEGQESRREAPFRTGVYPDALVFCEGKDGSTVTRQYGYPEDQAAVLPALRVIAKTRGRQMSETLPELPRASWYPALSSFGIYGEEFREAFGFSLETGGSRAVNAKELREALRKDLQARTLETLQEPTLIRISFEGVNPENGIYEYSEEDFAIKPDDRNTLALILGADADKWIDYAQGGFAASDRVAVFLCEYEETGEGETRLKDWRRAESTDEVRDWMSRVSSGAERMFQWPENPELRVQVYALDELRDSMEDGSFDPEDPETLARLPEIEGVWSRDYQVMLK